ncbi:MAG: hypothetical protein JNJ40_12990 [Bacteroidia bacterium]|nr:hypothetical protein [Bacteroidia bacterium]
MNKNLVLFFCLSFLNCFSQIKENFDFDLTKKIRFNDSQQLCSQLLLVILNKDSTQYSLYYNSSILCLLIKEDIEKEDPKVVLNTEEICGENITNKVFNLASKKIRSQLFINADSSETSELKILNFSQERKKVEMKSKYEFTQYDLKLFFTNKKNKKTYVLSVMDVIYANKKWFLVEPSYSILEHQ